MVTGVGRMIVKTTRKETTDLKYRPSQPRISRREVGRWIMPQYDFLCHSCDKFFFKTLTLADYEEAEIVCPNCGSDDVEQQVPPSARKSA
jgi:putative FmdB family regulatory protein